MPRSWGGDASGRTPQSRPEPNHSLPEMPDVPESLGHPPFQWRPRQMLSLDRGRWRLPREGVGPLEAGWQRRYARAEPSATRSEDSTAWPHERDQAEFPLEARRAWWRAVHRELPTRSRFRLAVRDWRS